MMKRFKKILLACLVVFAAIQFIQPARNTNNALLPTDITKIYRVPDSVLAVLKSSCYDCHSNNTRYPWYSRIQPAARFMASHIRKGKSELNFSEFGGYANRRQESKLKGISNSIEGNTMPLSSYLSIHRNAKLTDQNKKILTQWAREVFDSLSANDRK